MNPQDITPVRNHTRELVSILVCLVATGQAAGLATGKSTMYSWNDVSRFCTVWSLVERGTYAIDDCPWQGGTQDKIYKESAFAGGSAASKPIKHYYSSKPPLLPTLVAGLIYPFRYATGVPLHAEFSTSNGKKWKSHVLYFKPVIILINVVPFGVFLRYYSRLLDRVAISDFAWYTSLFAAAWGTQLFAFTDTFNNHTIAAFSAFFAIYPLLLIIDQGREEGRLFAAAGFFGMFAACNELPATLFVALLALILLRRDWATTLRYFVPAAAIPCAAFFVTQYLAVGSLIPAYIHRDWYEYPGSVWAAQGGENSGDEEKLSYTFNMILGHHGVLSLTPIFLLSVLAVATRRGSRPAIPYTFTFMTAFITIIVLDFYIFRTGNYGGNSQAMRWLLWLFPFWLTLLPQGLERCRAHPSSRRLALLMLFLSAFSVGYALIGTWYNPWISQLYELLGY